MKKFIAFTLMLVLILACLAPAIAATAELTAMSHGGTAQTGYVKKTKTGDPSVTINSLTGLQDTLLLNFRIRYSNGTAATSNYTFSGTGPRTVYYLLMVSTLLILLSSRAYKRNLLRRLQLQLISLGHRKSYQSFRHENA